MCVVCVVCVRGVCVACECGGRERGGELEDIGTGRWYTLHKVAGSTVINLTQCTHSGGAATHYTHHVLPALLAWIVALGDLKLTRVSL